MANTIVTAEYTYETLEKLSGWNNERVRKDVNRGALIFGSLRSVAEWIAANGDPELRAKMARPILAAVFGLNRTSKDEEMVSNLVESVDLLHEIFKLDDDGRHGRGDKISKGLKKASRTPRDS